MGCKPAAIKNDVAQVDAFSNPVSCGNLVFLISHKMPATWVDYRFRDTQVTVESSVQDSLERNLWTAENPIRKKSTGRP